MQGGQHTSGRAVDARVAAAVALHDRLDVALAEGEPKLRAGRVDEGL